MPKKVQCPGCKSKYEPGRSYTQHVNSCKDLVSASDKALKIHKIVVAKKAKDKKVEIARRRELMLMSRAAQDEPVPMDQADDFVDDQGMDVDIQLNSVSPENKRSIIIILKLIYRMLYHLNRVHLYLLLEPQDVLVDTSENHFVTAMLCQPTHP
jgi:uncharacterized C2H2 Zn-finger protein